MGALELFELSLLGGASERRFRRLRPETERLPWGSLDLAPHEPGTLLAARRHWTRVALGEHTAAAAAAATVQALVLARAPVDLVAVAARFVEDELVHVELCARLAGELGGGTPILYDPSALIEAPDPELRPLLRAAELVVRIYCCDEALSTEVARSEWRAARHPLVRGLLGRIAKDEAAHGQFGWTFLDWADAELTADDRRHLARVAASRVAFLERDLGGESDAANDGGVWPSDPAGLGLPEPGAYRALVRRTLDTHVRRPLAARGLMT